MNNQHSTQSTITSTDDTLSQLRSLSGEDLALATGGSPDPGSPRGGTRTPHIYNQHDADVAKRNLDGLFGTGLGDPGRAVARRVPGHPDQFTVETPRLDARGTRVTI